MLEARESSRCRPIIRGQATPAADCHRLVAMLLIGVAIGVFLPPFSSPTPAVTLDLSDRNIDFSEFVHRKEFDAEALSRYVVQGIPIDCLGKGAQAPFCVSLNTSISISEDLSSVIRCGSNGH